MTDLNRAVIKGVDRTGLVIAFSTLNLLSVVVLVAMAGSFGLIAVTIATLARHLLTWPPSAYFVYLVCKLTVQSQLKAGHAALFAAGAVVYPVLLFLVSGSSTRAEYRSAAHRLASSGMDGRRRFFVFLIPL